MKNYLPFLSCLLILIYVNLSFAQIEYVSKIIDQPDSPIIITSYDAKYYPYDDPKIYLKEGTTHRWNFYKSSQKTVYAIEFRILCFNFFNEFFHSHNLIRLGPYYLGTKEEPTWGRFTNEIYTPFSFYTGIFFVNRVRFKDGEIWEANLQPVLLEVMKIKSDFNLEDIDKEDMDVRGIESK